MSGTHPRPNESSSQSHILLRLFHYHLPINVCVFQVVSFLQDFLPNLCMRFPLLDVLHAQPISSQTTTNSEAPRYTTFSSLLLLPSSYVQMFFSASSSQTPAACFSLHVRDQVSYPNKRTGKILFVYILTFSAEMETEDSELNHGEHSSNFIFSEESVASENRNEKQNVTFDVSSSSEVVKGYGTWLRRVACVWSSERNRLCMPSTGTTRKVDFPRKS